MGMSKLDEIVERGKINCAVCGKNLDNEVAYLYPGSDAWFCEDDKREDD
jgi:hypothetical protein